MATILEFPKRLQSRSDMADQSGRVHERHQIPNIVIFPGIRRERRANLDELSENSVRGHLSIERNQ